METQFFDQTDFVLFLEYQKDRNPGTYIEIQMVGGFNTYINTRNTSFHVTQSGELYSKNMNPREVHTHFDPDTRVVAAILLEYFSKYVGNTKKAVWRVKTGD